MSSLFSHWSHIAFNMEHIDGSFGVYVVNFKWKGGVNFSPAPVAFLGLEFLTNFTGESLDACGIFGT